MIDFFKSHRQTFLISCLLFLTFLVYVQVLRHEFLNWDDNTHITENLQVRSLSLENIGRIFTSTIHKTYIPLTILSFAVEYSFVGFNPVLYYLNNLLLHLLVVFLIFRLAIVLGLDWRGAIVAAFVFALHPMHVESVAWATERKDVLYGAFYLGAVLWYLRFQKTRQKKDFCLSLLMGFLSMLSKPMALSLPLILLLCDWFSKGSLKKEDWLNKVPYAIFIVPLAWITFSANTHLVGQQGHHGYFFPLWAGVFYVRKFFWPVHFVPQYIPVMPANIWEFDFWFTCAVILFGLLVFWFWRNQWFRFAVLWYVFSIFFLLSYDYKVVIQSVADRFMYLPSLGFCLFAGHLVERVLSEKRLGGFWVKLSAGAILVAVAVLMLIKTFTQIGVWKNSFTFWNYIIKSSSESYLAYNNRGRIYERQGKLDLAVADYRQAIRINPQYAKAHKNIAMIYERLGDISSAIEAYSKAVEVKPNYSGVYNNRALLYMKLGKMDLALADYNSAIASDPRYVLGYVNRGAYFVGAGDIQRGLQDLNYAIKLEPNSVAAYNARAEIYLRVNDLKKALRDCQASLKLKQAQPAVLMICSEVSLKLGEESLSQSYADRARHFGFRDDGNKKVVTEE